MTTRLGANPIGWSNDDMQEIGGETSLETCLAEAREAGFEGMELGHKFPREAHGLKAALAPYNLACVSGWYSAELLRRDAAAEMRVLRPHRDLLKAMGSNVLIFAETSNAIHGDMKGPLSQRPRMAAYEWKQFGVRITEVAQWTADEGVRPVYYHHMGTIVESPDDIDAFMHTTGDAAHLLLDTGHATWDDADPVKLARDYHSRISHVHAKDVRAKIIAKGRAQDWSFLKAVQGEDNEFGIFTVTGDGMVDYVAVFEALKPYVGWIILEAEQDPKKAPPLIYAKKGVAHLRAAIKEARFV